jgi:cytochrome oxidase Cu insertion factor (SCO1/SenC/PrrC family)
MILLALLLVVGACFVLAVGGVSWTASQAVQAQKYRKLMAEQAAQADRGNLPGSWTIVYRMNNKTRSTVVQAPTEEAALLIFIKGGGSPRGIVSVTKG